MKIFNIAIILNIIFSYSLLSQNVKVIYSKKDYPYIKRDEVPTFNYKLRISDNGNVLSVTSVDKKKINYIYLDSLGNEIYSGEVEVLKYPIVVKQIEHFVIKKNKLLCYTTIYDDKTEMYSHIVIGIDMAINKIIYEKLIDYSKIGDCRSITFCGNLLSESVYLVEWVKQTETKKKISFSLLNDESEIIKTDKLELENWEKYFSMISNNTLISYDIVYDKLNLKSTEGKIQILKYDLITKTFSKSEILLDFPIINNSSFSYFYGKNDASFIHEMIDFTTRDKKNLLGSTEYHTYGLFELNINDVKSSKISYYNSEQIKEYLKNSTPNKISFDNYFPYSFLLLKDNTTAALVFDAFQTLYAKKYGSFKMNSNLELSKTGNYVFKPDKKDPTYLDLAASRSGKGYYLIDIGELNSDEIKDKAQKGKDYYIIYNIDGTKITRQTISDDPENTPENSFLKSGLMTYYQTNRDHKIRYDWNESKNIFCYMLKNEKAGTYKYVWLYFE